MNKEPKILTELSRELVVKQHLSEKMKQIICDPPNLITLKPSEIERLKSWGLHINENPTRVTDLVLWAFNRGIEVGRRKKQDEIRQALGII